MRSLRRIVRKTVGVSLLFACSLKINGTKKKQKIKGKKGGGRVRERGEQLYKTYIRISPFLIQYLETHQVKVGQSFGNNILPLYSRKICVNSLRKKKGRGRQTLRSSISLVF